MRWARFDHKGTPSYAIVENDTIIPVQGSPFGHWDRTSEKLKLEDVKLLVPVIPPTFYAAGMNYPEHVREVAAKIGQKPALPTQADIGYRANNALIAQGTRDGNIRVETPLIGLRKWEIVRLGVELGAPLHVSWSCYAGEIEACGVCESCTLRLRAFAEAGAVDPIPYARRSATQAGAA